jgi:hypothetical protein
MVRAQPVAPCSVPSPCPHARAGGPAGYLSYATELFDRITAEHLPDGLLAVLMSAVAWPGDPLSALQVPATGQGSDQHSDQQRRSRT